MRRWLQTLSVVCWWVSKTSARPWADTTSRRALSGQAGRTRWGDRRALPGVRPSPPNRFLQDAIRPQLVGDPAAIPRGGVTETELPDAARDTTRAAWRSLFEPPKTPLRGAMPRRCRREGTAAPRFAPRSRARSRRGARERRRRGRADDVRCDAPSDSSEALAPPAPTPPARPRGDAASMTGRSRSSAWRSTIRRCRGLDVGIQRDSVLDTRPSAVPRPVSDAPLLRAS
jgi:hypothetical protein